MKYVFKKFSSLQLNMPSLDEQILQELSKHTRVVEYSDLREKFKDQNFVERLGFLITTGNIVVVGYKPEKSRHPKEATKINRIYQQYSGDRGSIKVSDTKRMTQYVIDLFSGKEDQSSAVEDIDMESEPLLLTKENSIKALRNL
jgi:hypothetical protein